MALRCARQPQTPEKYNLFLSILQKYAKRDLTIESVYSRMSELFDGQADLQRSFVSFLPKRVSSKAPAANKQPLLEASPNGTSSSVRVAPVVDLPGTEQSGGASDMADSDCSGEGEAAARPGYSAAEAGVLAHYMRGGSAAAGSSTLVDHYRRPRKRRYAILQP
jgi:hypothetical protein